MAAKRQPKRDLSKVSAPAGVPDYLSNYLDTDESLEGMKEYRVLPRFKIIQSTSSGELLELFDAGDIILSPGNALVAKKQEPFHFVPVYFFVEFCKWSDLDDGESPAILGRSFDPSSDIAKNSRDAETRHEVYGSGFTARYVEHLNFAGFLYGDHDLGVEAAVQTYSRGEFSTGRGFISAVSIRKTPLWSQVWQFRTGFRERGAKRKWWGLDAGAPEERSFILEDEVDFFRGAHDELKELHEKQKLIVDHEGAQKDEKATSSDSSEF